MNFTDWLNRPKKRYTPRFALDRYWRGYRLDTVVWWA
jgi:hypothetical protein